MAAYRGMLLCLALSSCTVPAEVSDADRSAVMRCTDTRDGETFTYAVSSARNLRVGLGGADTCGTVTDSDGNERTLCKSQEVYMKCVKVQQ